MLTSADSITIFFYISDRSWDFTTEYIERTTEYVSGDFLVTEAPELTPDHVWDEEHSEGSAADDPNGDFIGMNLDRKHDSLALTPVKKNVEEEKNKFSTDSPIIIPNDDDIQALFIAKDTVKERNQRNSNWNQYYPPYTKSNTTSSSNFYPPPRYPYAFNYGFNPARHRPSYPKYPSHPIYIPEVHHDGDHNPNPHAGSMSPHSHPNSANSWVPSENLPSNSGERNQLEKKGFNPIFRESTSESSVLPEDGKTNNPDTAFAHITEDLGSYKTSNIFSDGFGGSHLSNSTEATTIIATILTTISGYSTSIGPNFEADTSEPETTTDSTNGIREGISSTEFSNFRPNFRHNIIDENFSTSSDSDVNENTSDKTEDSYSTNNNVLDRDVRVNDINTLVHTPVGEMDSRDAGLFMIVLLIVCCLLVISLIVLGIYWIKAKCEVRRLDTKIRRACLQGLEQRVAEDNV